MSQYQQDNDGHFDLSNVDPMVRKAALWRLGDTSRGPLSPEDIAALSAATADTDPAVRSSALYLLARGGRPDEATARELVVRGLRDPHPEVRTIALGCIGELAAVRDSGWIVNELIDRLEDDDGIVVDAALHCLRGLPRGAHLRAFGPSNGSLERWVFEASAGDRRRRVVALLALEAFGALALGPLEWLSADPDPIVRFVTLIVVANIGCSDSLRIVERCLDDADPRVRIEAIVALRTIGVGSVPALTSLLSHPEGQARWAAADSLEALGSEAQSAVPDLIEMLRRSDDAAGHKAVLALAAVGAGHPAMVPALIEALDSLVATIRGAAAYALSTMGPHAVAAIVPLLRLQCARGDSTGPLPVPDLGQLLSTAAAIVPGAVTTALGEALGDENADVRREAAAWLANPALRGHGPARLLSTACHDADPYVRAEAIMSLGDLGAAAVPAAATLASLLRGDGRSGVVNLRQRAALALGQIGPEAAVAVPALIGALNDPDPALRITAAWSLAQIDPTITVGLPILIENLGASHEPERRYAATGLGRLGPSASEAIPALEKLLVDETPAVRRDAEMALKQIRE